MSLLGYTTDDYDGSGGGGALYYIRPRSLNLVLEGREFQLEFLGGGSGELLAPDSSVNPGMGFKAITRSCWL